MAQTSEIIADDLLERVLERLGFSARPEPTLTDLSQIYAAWCRRVPFDNVRKLIHLSSQAPGPLPGDTPTAFFTDWLDGGTGGTCWAGNGALHALLVSLGFEASRGIGTMITAPDIPPNHGTVLVALDGGHYLVDASILHGEPLRLDEHEPTRTNHPAWGVMCTYRDGHWHVGWRPMHSPGGIECRIDRFPATPAEFHELHEQTRPWSPFNYELSARLIRGDDVVGAAFGKRVVLEGSGGVVQEPLPAQDRLHLLVDELGISEEVAHRLPPETPTPPRPGSRAAQEAELQREAPARG
jgi:N-hydroxyarylamine O-acetyltransferase